MAELDKKIQKAQTDLVQSVLEAQEKRNLERIDMLVTNAIKQLKMSRFKPDQTTCLSLIYLARINPKIFAQSNVIKDLLKSLLRRDNGPPNIKGGKNDIILPVMAANILLACCDSIEIRTMILHKIEQWLSSNQKVAELVQHLMATLCMKCQGDQQTITALLEMRQHWLQYLEDSFEPHGPVPADLCSSIRNLLHIETNCESQLFYLKFLIKHDADIEGLGKEISKFIVARPISLSSMCKKEEFGIQLNRLILKTYIKLFKHLKNSPNEDSVPPSTASTVSSEQVDVKKQEVKIASGSHQTVLVKLEPKDDKSSMMGDLKKEKIVKNELKQTLGSAATTWAKSETKTEDSHNDVTLLYVRLPDCSRVIRLSKSIIEAVLSLLALVEDEAECKEEFDELLNCWLHLDEKSQNKYFATIYEDFALTTVYNLPDSLRLKLVLSPSSSLVEFGLSDANAAQLIKLLQQFSSPLSTINKIIKRLELINDTESIRSEIKDTSYFNQLIEFYSHSGAKGASDLHNRLSAPLPL